MFSLTLCDTVIPSKALEINTTCASSFFTDEWSDQDALISETKVINVYLHLSHFRKLAEPNAQSQTTVWTATSSGHYDPKHFISLNAKGIHETSEITMNVSSLILTQAYFQWNYIRRLHFLVDFLWLSNKI